MSLGRGVVLVVSGVALSLPTLNGGTTLLVGGYLGDSFSKKFYLFVLVA